MFRASHSIPKYIVRSECNKHFEYLYYEIVFYCKNI